VRCSWEILAVNHLLEESRFAPVMPTYFSASIHQIARYRIQWSIFYGKFSSHVYMDQTIKRSVNKEFLCPLPNHDLYMVYYNTEGNDTAGDEGLTRQMS
jgi:hypothetical protein